MPVSRKFHGRNVNGVVEAYAEVLFKPGGSVSNWTNMFVGRIRAKTIAFAPSNKRPRWAHYGKPLKESIVSSRPVFWGNGRDAMRLYGGVGSTAPYAMYVDQGTGIYGGSGPYPAKILPPWTHGGASLYEHTWRPTGPGGALVAPVMIKGQPGQWFFEKGLASAFRSMRLRSAQLPGEGTPKISNVMGSIPSVIENFVGNTASTPAFIGQLEEWRSWRDAAWKSREGLGRGGGVGSRAHAQAVALSQNKPKPPPRQPKHVPVKPIRKPPKGWASVAQKKQAALQQFIAQNPHIRILEKTPGGLVVQTKHGPQNIPWSRLYHLID